MSLSLKVMELLEEAKAKEASEKPTAVATPEVVVETPDVEETIEEAKAKEEAEEEAKEAVEEPKKGKKK